ncbi:monovalent cation:proton antiporter-2 (CPA2) family protein [Insolitispirillum peregrinum]|uniref:YbaL family putative K(+) efflux transporter n=1 Tax=Insolitispirillum peregrinum TaxID=80876 RepID=UPI00361E8BCB
MLHDAPLISSIVAGLGLAFIFGAIANRLKIPPLVGYLFAGVLVGPHTPGFVADQTLAPELAEIGVILLMFGVGLHFSVKDLLSVRAIAIPGAVVQIAAATCLGGLLAMALGWGWGAALLLGLALSTASTVVLLRALQDQRILDTSRGRIAVGWLVVEDLAMVLALVLLPAFAGAMGGTDSVATHDPIADYFQLNWVGVLALTLGKVVAFVVVMLVVGRRVIPWVLHQIAQSGSRELFRLGVLAIALGVAYGAAKLFGVSLALGAFFAGMIMSESELSHQAAQDSLPLRDAFSVLFFVSVGMLFDPLALIDDPLPILAVLFIIIFGKSVAAFVIVRLFHHPIATALTISASLAQIGEFSFILAELGVNLGVLPPEGRSLILAGAILSILLNPLAFHGAERLRPWLERKLEKTPPAPVPGEQARITTDTIEDNEPAPAVVTVAEDAPVTTSKTNHIVLVGCGRVGSLIVAGLAEAQETLVVIEDATRVTSALMALDVETIIGNAVRDDVLAAANVAQAATLVLAIPNAFEAAQVIKKAKALNPQLSIIARAHSDSEVSLLEELEVSAVIMGEREIAKGVLSCLTLPPKDPQPDAVPA